MVETIHKNFPDFEVKLDAIGLSLGTKFRYKINNAEIRLQQENGAFSTITLKNISIKFPLFFLIGKQDIDIAVEHAVVEGFNYSKWCENDFKLTTIQLERLSIPKFFIDNRVNVTLNDISFKNDKTESPLPFHMKKIKHLVLKDFSLLGKTAIELGATLGLSRLDKLKVDTSFETVVIGYFRLGQLFSTGNSEYKVLVEVKETDNPLWGWLTSHRLQLSKQDSQIKTEFKIFGSALDGRGELVLQQNSMSWRDLNIGFVPQEMVRESSELKNILFLVGNTLGVKDLSTFSAKLSGDLTLLKDKVSSAESVLMHLSSSWTKGNDKVDMEFETRDASQSILFKKGSDLSYRNIKLQCLAMYCLQDNLESIEVNFYNQILLDDETAPNSLFSLSQDITKGWGTMSKLISDKKVTPLKIYWRKNRWSDFEFDLIADATMNSKVLATENINIKHQGKDSSKASMSLMNSGDNTVSMRFLAKIFSLPTSVLAKFLPESQAEFSGSSQGSLAFEFKPEGQRLSAEFFLEDGHIQWLNLDDLYRRTLFKNPEDEIRYPQLSWNQHFKKASLFLDWADKQKELEIDFLLPKSQRKNIKLSILNSFTDFAAAVEFPGLTSNSKKYLLQGAGKGEPSFSFKFSLVDKELKLVDSTAEAESQPVSEVTP